MPIIDDLNPALAAADEDVLPVSQGRSARKVTRAQLLAGMQPAIAVPPGVLLGRRSADIGAPETIRLGSNLVMQAGTLAAVTTQLDVPSLPPAATPDQADLVAFAQGGRNVATSYAGFIAGIGQLNGVDASRLTVTAEAALSPRSLAQITGDAVTVEAYGAKGDGVTDDTAAFAAAILAGRPLRLGAKRYVVNGQFTIAQPGVTLLGVPGITTLLRSAQAGNGAWIAVQADEFRADGVIFDANGFAVTVESWGVLVGTQCRSSDFHRCDFKNASGSSLGSGLVFQSSDPSICSHSVRDCSFYGNAAHGLWVQACSGILVTGCRAHDNVRYGIVADFNDATFSKKVRLAQIIGNRCWANERGISVGNYNETNGQPARWGNANPDATGILVEANVCHNNRIYGISTAGLNIVVQGNLLSDNGRTAPGGAGLLVNAAQSAVLSNIIIDSGVYGIDCGGSIESEIANNSITGGTYGINCGGSQDIHISGNRLRECAVFAICALNVESDGSGVNFGIPAKHISITDNWIGMNGSAGGIWLRDGPSAVLVARNHFVGTGAVESCLWADTDAVQVSGNHYNFMQRHVCGVEISGGVTRVVVPDIVENVSLGSVPQSVQAIVSSRQVQLEDKIGFVRVTSGGSGYSQATITFGGTGSGAQARAVISDGSLIGVEVTNPGHGYGAIGAMIPVTIDGDGVGATAVGWASAPLPEERRLAVRCETSTKFAATRIGTAQTGWVDRGLEVPAGGEIRWAVVDGSWMAERAAGTSVLAGEVQHVSVEDAVGCISRIGRGTPEGVVAAPPGSDWRNLDGGAGNTYWIKQTGSEATGWIAIA